MGMSLTDTAHVLPKYVMVKDRVRVIKHHTMMVYGGVEYSVSLSNFALDGDEWSASCSGRFTSGVKSPGIHVIGGWVFHSAGLDAMAKTKTKVRTPAGIEPRSSISS
jgi:hypothetical protein